MCSRRVNEFNDCITRNVLNYGLARAANFSPCTTRKSSLLRGVTKFKSKNLLKGQPHLPNAFTAQRLQTSRLTFFPRVISMYQADEFVPPAKNFPSTIPSENSTPVPESQPIIYSSAELMKGRREVWIEHGDQMYRLRITSAKKLYLTK